MGMLMHRHRVEQIKADGEADAEPKPLDRQNRTELQQSAAARGLDTDGTKAELRARITEHDAEPEPEPDGEPAWADLTDEQLAEAYATNVDPDPDAYPGRDAAVEALQALDAEPDKG